MQLYHYKKTGEFSHETKARPNPQEQGKFLIPNRATDIEPPESQKGFAVVWNGEDWELVEDHRGTAIYNTETRAKETVKQLGELPEGFTEVEPPSPNHTWNGTTWALDEAAFTESLTAALKSKRDELWQSSTVTLTNGAVLKFDRTTRDHAMETMEGMESDSTDVYPGWVDEEGDEFGMGVNHFQEYFAKLKDVRGKAWGSYSAVKANHKQTPYTDIETALNTLTNLFNTEE